MALAFATAASQRGVPAGVLARIWSAAATAWWQAALSGPQTSVVRFPTQVARQVSPATVVIHVLALAVTGWSNTALPMIVSKPAFAIVRRALISLLLEFLATTRPVPCLRYHVARARRI